MASELDTLSSIERHGDLNPVQRTRLEELRKMGSAGNAEGITGGPINTGSSFGGGGSYADLLNQQLKAMQDANAPAVASLQSSIPEIQAKYQQTATQLQSQESSIENRYKNIIDQITGAKQEAVGNVQTATAREFGRRGISLTSGAYDQALNQNVNPLIKYYSGQEQSAGLSKEDTLTALRNQIAGLTTQQVDEQRAVQNAIAQLMAGGNQQAATQALQLFQANQQAQQSAADRALQEKLASTPKSQGLEIINVGGVGYAIDPSTGQIVNTFGGGGSDASGIDVNSGGGSDWEEIIPATTKLQQQTGGNVSLPNYNAMANQYNPALNFFNPLLGGLK